MALIFKATASLRLLKTTAVLRKCCRTRFFAYMVRFKEHIEYTFAVFYKVVLCNASLSAYRDIGRRQKREISLDYLMKERYYNPSTTDSYFAEQTSSTELIVCDEKIVIENERLAKVFSDLLKLRQEVFGTVFFWIYR